MATPMTPRSPSSTRRTPMRRRWRATSISRSRTSRPPPTRCARSTTGSTPRTAMSAWKCRPISPTTPTARSPRRQRLWAAVDRPNLMIKIPGTPAGVPAIAATIDAGINVNVTLLFGIEAYKAVAMAFVAGLEKRAARGEPIDRIASVASFFVSRIDSKIDDAIDAGDGRRRGQGAQGQGRDRQRQAGLCLVSGFHRVRPLAGARRQGRDAAAAALGVDRHQEPRLSRHALSRHADRPGHGQHRAAQDDGRVPRSRHRRRDADAGYRRRAARPGGGRAARARSATASPTMLVEEGVASFAKAFDDLLGAIAAKHPATA